MLCSFAELCVCLSVCPAHQAGLGGKGFGTGGGCRQSFSEEKDQPWLFPVRRHQSSTVVLPGSSRGNRQWLLRRVGAAVSPLLSSGSCPASFDARSPTTASESSAAQRDCASTSQPRSVPRSTSSAVARGCPCHRLHVRGNSQHFPEFLKLDKR